MTKLQHGNCVDCKFRKVDMFEEPCTTCAWIESGTFDNWQPNDVNADIDHSLMAGRTFEEKPSKRREKQLQERVDTYRQALADLMGELQNNTLTILGNSRLRWVWGHCQSLLDGTVPLPASSAAQCISRLMQDKDAMQTEIAELRRHVATVMQREDAANKRIAELEAQIGGIRSPFIDTSVLIKEGSVKEVIVNGETFVLQEERDIALAICTELVEMIEHGFRIDGVRPNF